jgi:hypothetical protein
MLDNKNALNNVNPFVNYGPGTSNKPYGFSPDNSDKEKVQCTSYGCSFPSSSNWEPYETKSSLCEWGIHAQTNGSMNAPSCLSKKNPISCPLNRPLEPTREIIPDLYTLVPYKDPVPKSLQKNVGDDWTMIVVGVVILVVALHLVKK